MKSIWYSSIPGFTSSTTAAGWQKIRLFRDSSREIFWCFTN
ncbi:hypothetical protein [Iningainema tapete]|nr:hypothetical protein [Iningainema tapete]